MSEDLIDVRGKVTRPTDVMLRAYARANNCTYSEAIRDVLHEVAQKRNHESIIAARMMLVEGCVGAVQGITGTNNAEVGGK